MFDPSYMRVKIDFYVRHGGSFGRALASHAEDRTPSSGRDRPTVTIRATIEIVVFIVDLNVVILSNHQILGSLVAIVIIVENFLKV